MQKQFLIALITFASSALAEEQMNSKEAFEAAFAKAANDVPEYKEYLKAAAVEFQNRIKECAEASDIDTCKQNVIDEFAKMNSQAYARAEEAIRNKLNEKIEENKEEVKYAVDIDGDVWA